VLSANHGQQWQETSSNKPVQHRLRFGNNPRRAVECCKMGYRLQALGARHAKTCRTTPHRNTQAAAALGRATLGLRARCSATRGGDGGEKMLRVTCLRRGQLGQHSVLLIPKSVRPLCVLSWGAPLCCAAEVGFEILKNLSRKMVHNRSVITVMIMLEFQNLSNLHRIVSIQEWGFIHVGGGRDQRNSLVTDPPSACLLLCL
jgi:hypothetical protein